MKTLILKLIVCGAALLPFGQAQAATYGGFAPGKTFTFTVTERVSARSVGTKVSKNVPVPSGIPDYAKGKRVKFTIGPKGQLTASGMSIPYKKNAITANVYASVPTATKPGANIGQVYKTKSNKPTGVSLEFIKISISGFTSTTSTVTYILE